MRIVRSGDHRGLAAAVVTGVLAVCGMVAIGLALTIPQGHLQPPQPIPVAADSIVPAAPELSPASPRPGPTDTAPQVVDPVLPSSIPLTLAIPAIHVRSSLLKLGVTAKGTMQTPAPGPQYNKAGWYRYSPTPGSLGPAVIAGHVDSAREGPSVFFRLGSLRPGDTITVTRADGSVAFFAVDSVHRYAKDHFPSKLVYGDTNHAALRLITCGGQFDRGSGNYLDNIVVFASLVRATGVA